MVKPTILYSTTGSVFELGRPLGNGGMGRVYLAQQHSEGSSGGQLVALKLLRPGAPSQARRLFYHEGTLLPRLQHPNIVHYIEHGRGAIPGVGPLDYQAHGYVAGETIADLLRRTQRPLAAAAMLGIIAQVAAALSYLHQRGVVHCDVKPSNIMLEHAAPRAVLIDFGIARAPDFVGQPVAVGTAQYMAPEQADPQGRCDGRADLYALGVVIYELLAGQRLFPHRNTADIRQGRMITADIRDLSDALEEPAAHVVARCLQPDPAARYPNVEVLLDDLRAAVTSIASG